VATASGPRSVHVATVLPIHSENGVLNVGSGAKCWRVDSRRPSEYRGVGGQPFPPIRDGRLPRARSVPRPSLQQLPGPCRVVVHLVVVEQAADPLVIRRQRRQPPGECRRLRLAVDGVDEAPDCGRGRRCSRNKGVSAGGPTQPSKAVVAALFGLQASNTVPFGWSMPSCSRSASVRSPSSSRQVGLEMGCVVARRALAVTVKSGSEASASRRQRSAVDTRGSE